MFDFSFDPSRPEQLWSDIADACAAVTDGERDAIANMANVAAIIWQALPDLNWAGFYRFDGTELVLGPFQGKSACIRIALDRGVCGAAARTRTTQCVEDVHTFAGHIACDADSRSELVVPVMAGDRLVGVLDLDSPLPRRFGPADVAGAEALVGRIADRLTV